MTQHMPFDDYIHSMATKLSSAGVLLFDDQGRFLLLKPSYKEGWGVPGGLVDPMESPRQAAMREMFEETGLRIVPQRLLCIQYKTVNTRLTPCSSSLTGVCCRRQRLP